MYVRTVPRIAVRQMGQSCTVGAQVSQHTRWLQGKNSVEISLSMQILHSIVSFSRRFSSFRLSTSEQKFNSMNCKRNLHNYVISSSWKFNEIRLQALWDNLKKYSQGRQSWGNGGRIPHPNFVLGTQLHCPPKVEWRHRPLAYSQH